ncbi:MAG: ATP-dependent helicase [Candidatus Riflebacteria bacterium]|nr:ATP-dependent helicase [Candidatus Riflebacteria bacterium]
MEKHLGLTDNQREAIEAPPSGRLKIIAGAGSGKTEVLTRRIAALIKTGVRPNELVALTYTNKAAAAMKDRLILKQGLSAGLLQETTISTFHSFLARILKSDPFAAGIDISTTILTESARKLLLSQISTRFGEIHSEALFSGPEGLGGKMCLRLLAAFPRVLGKIRRYLLSPHTFYEEALRGIDSKNDIFMKNVLNWLFRFHCQYLQILEERRLLDFDDILIKGRETIAARMEQGDPPRERVFLIDEFQDNNRDQFAIINLFLENRDKLINSDISSENSHHSGEICRPVTIPANTNPDGNPKRIRKRRPVSSASDTPRDLEGHLTVVGDPRQSIYRFQGADLATFNEFTADRIITLRENFRSYTEILTVADRYLAAGNLDTSVLAVDTQKAVAGISPRQKPVAILLSPDADDKREAETIAGIIDRLVRSGFQRAMKPTPLNFGDIAIIVDSIKNLPKPFEDALLARNIPYLLSGGLGFYDRGEIMGIVSFLRLLVNPRDDRSLVNILSGPLYGISDAEIASLSMAGRTERVSLAEHFDRLPDAALPDRARELRDILTRLRDRRSSARLLDLVYYLLDEAGFREYAASQSHPLRRRRMENNLIKFVDIVRAFESNGLFTTLRDFLQYLEGFLASEADEDEAGIGLEDSDAVKILTIHKAKGLEFPVVFLPFLKNRIHRRSDLLTFTREHGLLLRKDENNKTRSDQKLKAHDAIESRSQQDEERRKWYVALTRAEELLIISGRASRAEKPEEPLYDLINIVSGSSTTAPDCISIGSVLPIEQAEKVTDEWLEAGAIPPVPPAVPPVKSIDIAAITSEVTALKSFLVAPLSSPQNALSISREEVFSLADLTMFEKCPRHFFYTRRHVTPFSDEPGPATRRIAGTLVHNTLRLYHSVSVSSLSSEERKTHLSDGLIRLIPLVDGCDESVEQRARAILNRYLVSPLAAHDAWLLEAEINMRFSAPSGSFRIRGFADRVDLDGDDISVIDYKTRNFTQEAHAGYTRQMALYLAAARHGILGRLGELNFARIELVYLTPEEVRIEPSEPDLEAFERWAAKLVDRIRQESQFAPAPPETCAGCHFAILCGRSGTSSSVTNTENMEEYYYENR